MIDSTVNSALLLATVPNLEPPHFLDPVVHAAVTAVRRRLLIILFSRFFDSNSYGPTAHFNAIQRILTSVYVHATKVAQDLNKVLLDVDVLLLDLKEDLPADIGEGKDLVYRVQGDCIASPLPLSVLSLQQNYVAPDILSTTNTPEDSPQDPTLHSVYPVVALGGTFDHLHAGHKILLSMAAWITKEKVIVGVTDDALLTKKAYKEVLESIDTRIEGVRRFLHLFKPSLVLDIVPIDDVYGPTGWDPNIQALVVSKETISGAKSIADHRASRSLPVLQVFIVDVISSTSPNLDDEDAELLKQTKISSTYIREWIVKQDSDNV